MLTITPITKQYVSIDVASALASGAPAVISGVDVALVQPRSAPAATTTWVSATYADGKATVLVAGYDADPTGALVVPAGSGADLWIRVVDNPEVTATKVTRVLVETGEDEAVIAASPIAVLDARYDAIGAASTARAFAVQRANHTGTQSADTLTDGTTNKAFLATERTKLAGVATGATANATDAQLRDRSTHTGTQPASSLTGLDTATAGAITPGGSATAAAIAADPAVKAAFDGPQTPSSLPTGTALTRRYDPERQTYNLTPDTMRKWNAALARVKTGGTVARVSVVGHSVVVGTSTSPRHQFSFATKLRDAFNTKYGSAGTGIVYLVTTALTDDSRVVFGGTWATALGNRGAFNAGAYNATGTGNTITFTPDIPVDSFTVYYVVNTVTGTFSMSVDGGSATTAGSTHGGTETLASATISAGTLGTHSLTITAPASGSAYIYAVEGTVGSSGVRVSRVGRSGATVSTVTTAGTAGADSLATIFQSAPDLTVIMCQVNDYLTAVPVATYTANLTTLVQKAQLTGDVIVIADQNVLTQPNTTSGLYQSAYHAALYGLADSLGFAVLDIAARWKDYTTSVAVPPGLMAPSGIDATGVHPYVVGHQDIANALMAVVGGSIPSTALGYTDEQVRDVIGAALVAGTNVTITVDDAGDTITIASTGGGGGGATVLPTGAQQQGFTLSAYDPILANTGTTLGGGTHCLLMRCVATASATITNLYVGVGTAGAGATTTAGQTPQAGIYSVTGTQLRVTGDIGSILTGTTGMKALPLTSGLAVTAGTEYYLALFWSGTTSPLLQRVASNTIMYQAGVNGIAANGRFADITGGTTLPSSINPAALTAAGVAYWLGGA